MNEQQVNVIVDFWKQRTGRAAPKKVSVEMTYSMAGYFHMGEIVLNPIWADDETVFHELVHLEQWQDGRLWYRFDFSKGELQDTIEAIFEGKKVGALPYPERPAEIEACRIAKENLESFRLTNPWPVVA